MSRRFVSLVLSVLLVALSGASVARAQEPSANSEQVREALQRTAPRDERTGPVVAVLAGPVDPKAYRLGPGDGLSLELSGRIERQTPLLVDAEGRLRVPEAGVLAVAGRTLAEVRADVLARLRPIYPSAQVDLRLVSVRSFKVYVAGQVETPGAVQASAATRASEVLAGALALRAEASRRNIELRRRDGSKLRVDLDAFSFLGRTDGNPYLEDGDVLIVPPRGERLFAYGAFARPGEFERAEGDRVADLVDLAGGLRPGSDPSSARLVRFVGDSRFDTTVVDLSGLGTDRGPELEHQDRLYVRELPDYRRARNVTVSGEIRLPGVYAIAEGTDRLSRVLAEAGGLTDAAAPDRVLIFRPSAVPSQGDIEFERLSRLSRSEMTDNEYQTFKTKLASRQAAYVVDVRKLANDTEYDILLKDSDLILIDRSMQAVRVAGEVQRPSLLEFEAGRSGRDYIKLAGGFTRRADDDKVRLTRAGTNQTILLAEADEVRPGDFIWVPEKKEVDFWGVFKDVILVAGSVATIIILIRDN